METGVKGLEGFKDAIGTAQVSFCFVFWGCVL